MTEKDLTRCPKCNDPVSYGMENPTIIAKGGDLVHIYYHIWCNNCGWTGTELRKGSKKLCTPEKIIDNRQERGERREQMIKEYYDVCAKNTNDAIMSEEPSKRYFSRSIFSILCETGLQGDNIKGALNESEEEQPEIPDPRADCIEEYITGSDPIPLYVEKYITGVLKKMENLPFSIVISRMNQSEVHRTTPTFARKSWDNQMFVYMTHGKTVSASDWTGPKDCIDEETQTLTIRPHIDMRTARGDIIVGWTPSQEDMDANDWIQRKPVGELLEDLGITSYNNKKEDNTQDRSE